MRSTRSRQSGFTLIELLVVIAIIAVLAAILFPVFATAREKARQISCVSNMKQLSTALQMYTQDYDGFPQVEGCFFGSCSVAPPPSQTPIWYGEISSYVNNTQVLFCPSSAHNFQQTYTDSSGTVENFTGKTAEPVNTGQLSIGFNAETDPAAEYPCLDTSSPPSNEQLCSKIFSETITDSYFPYPSQTAAFGDSVAEPNGQLESGLSVSFVVLGAFPLDTPGGLSDRHSLGSNIAFLDGHAKWVRTVNAVPSPTMTSLDNISEYAKCVNYNQANIYWDPQAPDPQVTPTCSLTGT